MVLNNTYVHMYCTLCQLCLNVTHSLFTKAQVHRSMAKRFYLDSVLLISVINTYQLMSNVQLHGSNIFDSQMQMQTGNQNNDVSLLINICIQTGVAHKVQW